MDKNTFTGLFLIMIIIAGSFYLLKPSDAEIKKEQERAHLDSLKKAGKPLPATTAKFDSTKAGKVLDSAVLKQPFGAATVGTDQLVTLENSELLIKLSAKGGRVYSVQLKKFFTHDKKPLIMFDGAGNSFGLNLRAGDKYINTNDYYFTPSAPSAKVTGTDSTSVTMRLSYSPTQYLDYVYTLKGEGFKVGLTITPTGLDNVVANSNEINLSWAANPNKLEKDMVLERQYSTVYWRTTEHDVDYLSEGKDDAKEIADKKMQWVSFKQHFFSSALISDQGFTKSNLAVAIDIADTTHIKQMKAGLVVPKSSVGNFPLTFYFGPNKYSTLKDQGDKYELEKQINMGWGPLQYINRFAVLPVFTFLQQFGWNYGMIILALTIILKLVLSPLTYKSYLSMAKMRVLKPEMDEIKEKVGEDNPTLLQQEYMKLYKKAGVNPLGGCLPLLLQMPIVIAFFRFFPSLFELRGQSFLWMHDLSTYDTLVTFAPLPLIGWTHISLMCLLMTISTLIYTYFNNQISGATGQMKYIGYITPIIFFGALNGYPAGLNYYYFLANMLTFLQQYLIKFMVDDKKIHAQIQENKKKPEDKTKKKTGFAAKMEEMMRQQQQAQTKGKK
ncbi:membrane protein insertase YidC [Mucilaginibacter myungsuensis]|uniref:Membrane protein insertase YidC n=1 Tax=Mucilaginibacter myungsuensis TaxID=649104 RepID=A0A929PZF4_9SPHI|nr:membrane protein insertase YidC [Mucilaginibacter myungsuensis]MBE9664357.1 membrane protein insertase YidC [Mucilaginibacter myungsuensis]MDN3597067.1 membrane protein insertase YidC [Mucilaginibacter myungsuensis]